MVSVRRAQRHDLVELVRLHNRAGEFLGHLDPRLAPSSVTAARFKKAVGPMLGSRSYPIFVAQMSDREGLVGCVVGTVVDNRPFGIPEFGYISCLHVDEGWCGRDVGRRLLEATQGWCTSQGLGVTQTDVPSHSPTTRRFWERMDFTRFLDRLSCGVDAAGAQVGDSCVVIREGTMGDRVAVLSLWEEMMDYHAHLDRRLRVLPGASRHTAQAIGHWLRDDTTPLLVAQAGDDVVGFTLGGAVDLALGLHPTRYGHIAHMCVTSEWRRRGVGRELFAALGSWFQQEGLTSIHIYVSHLNPVSQRFWRSLGFEDYADRLWCDLQ